MSVTEKYKQTSKDYASQWGIVDDHVINIGASILMTRDSELQGGSFVQAILRNDLEEAVNRADNTCINYLRFFVGIKNNVGRV